MPVSSLDLFALIIDLAEQPRVLNCQYRLCRKGFQKLDHFGTKLPSPLSTHHQSANDPLFAQQRHGQAGSEAVALEHLAHARRVSALFEEIGNLHWSSARCLSSYQSVSRTRWSDGRGVDESLFHVISGAQQGLFRLLGVFVNRPAIGATQLDRVGDDTSEHGFEVERGANRLTNFTQCSQLTDRLHQLPCPCLQFLEQPHIFNRDDRLVGEGLEQGNLFVGERLNFFSPYIDDPNGYPLPEQRSSQPRSNTVFNPSPCVWKFALKSFSFHVRNMHNLAVDDSTPRNRAATERLANFSDRSPRKRSVFRRSSQTIAVDVINDRVLRFCHLGGIFGDGFQYRLDIRRRTCDDTQNLARGCLLLQRLFEFLEQPNVLNGDDGLICESFQELDLRRGERAHLGATRSQVSNEFLLLAKR